ncbi:hypothetical protein Aperf_G00000107934 [Anoplocephala perfoliata]
MLLNQSRSYRSLNISALLASGEFFIDDNGYLVALGNGTRYRLPSGPPEGRASGPYELQPILPGKNQQLADSAVDWLDLITSTTTTTTSTAIARMHLESSGNNTTNLFDQNQPETLSLYLGSTACSLAILVNVVLVVTSCWLLFRRRGRRKRGNSIHLQTFAGPRPEIKAEEKTPMRSPTIPSASSDSHSSSVSLSSDDSPRNQQCSRSKKNSSMHENQRSTSQTARPFVNNPHSCLGIGIHIGLMGFLLAVVHLVVSCFYLAQSPFSSVLCLFSTSIATDTIYCVLFNLITCLLCMILIGYLSKSPITRSGQQKFACLALLHSLPWALAAGSALFITLKPSNSSGQLSIFLTGYHFACVKAPQQESHVLTLILLVVIPLVGEFIVIILFFCCCKRLPGRVCFLSILLPVINAASFIPVLVINLRNLLLLPLIINPLIILLLYRFSMSHEKKTFSETREDIQIQDRSPLHLPIAEMSASMSSDIYFPQTILAITPHRCAHGDTVVDTISPKMCPHYQQILTHPQDCSLERRSCNEILQGAGEFEINFGMTVSNTFIKGSITLEARNGLR